ncbi:universal stress protein [Flavihumibacter stibioxidans]|uniref:UspA domain-containing protein n=1 Tax=Flavihumibacter stibioxidans TaxID=1834163 RepID=A0ABR7MCQ9_9BACT|nr:universal stress protein [Flavihumibacter stibioxidans]MBC6492822.1 hypothetical protein [Flavihumibacter stibioxidans]
MEHLLKQILVVVDFSETSRLVLNNIIPLANELKCDVHLLHVVKPSVWPSLVDAPHFIPIKSDLKAEATNKLMSWQSQFIPMMDKGRLLYSHCTEGGVEKEVRDFTLRHDIDMVILMQYRRFAWSKLLNRININRLARKIKCPVLNLPAAGNIHHIRNIVLPITNVLPLRKIMFAAYLARYHNASIHLVSLQEESVQQSETENPYLYKAYQLLRDNTNLRIECHPMSGNNIAGTTLQFAEKVNADLIVVQPGRETELPGMLNNIFSRFLFSASRIPVMAV